MSDIGEPVNMSTTMIKRMNELVGDHSVHMGLITDIILAQNNLGGKIREVQLCLKSILISWSLSSLTHEGDLPACIASTHFSPLTPQLSVSVRGQSNCPIKPSR